MDDLSTQVVAGLVVAATAAAGSLAWTSARREKSRRRPVHVSVAPIVGDSWSLALAGELPPGAGELENSNVQGRVVYDWLVERGAADHLETRFRLTVRSVAHATVVVREIRANVDSLESLDGTLVYSPTAGANSATLLVFDLDASTSEAWEYLEDGGRDRVGTAPYFHLHNVTLAPGEIHDFIIVGRATASMASWTLVVDLEIDGVAQEWEVVGPRGPFKTSGEPAAGFASTLDWAWWEGGRFQPTQIWDAEEDGIFT